MKNQVIINVTKTKSMFGHCSFHLEGNKASGWGITIVKDKETVLRQIIGTLESMFVLERIENNDLMDYKITFLNEDAIRGSLPPNSASPVEYKTPELSVKITQSDRELFFKATQQMKLKR